MQAGEVVQVARHRALGAGGLHDRLRHVQVDLWNASVGVDQSRGLSGGEAAILRFGIAIPHDLIAPLDPLPAAVLHVNLRLVAPDACQRLERGTQHVGIRVVRTVGAVRHHDESRIPRQIGARTPVPAEGPGERDGTRQFTIDERIHVGVADLAQESAKALWTERGQDNRAVNRSSTHWPGFERTLHRGRVAAIESSHADMNVRSAQREHRADRRHILVAWHAKHHRRPDFRLHSCDGQSIVQRRATRDEHRQATAVHRAHGWPRHEFRTAFLAHPHAMGDFEIVSVERRRLIGRKEHARVGHIFRCREGATRRRLLAGTPE